MSFIEKHYPDVGHARILLEGRLRELESRFQQGLQHNLEKESILHRNHHHQLESNIVHLYDLVRKTAENQSSMQKQMNMMRNKSVGNLSIHQIDHRQRVHHLENAYRKAEEKASSLSKRIQMYYPKLEKRQYLSRFDRYPFKNIENEIMNKKQQLEEDWKRVYERKIISENNERTRQQSELLQLSQQRQALDKLIQQEALNRMYIQQSIKMRQISQNIPEKLPTADFKLNQHMDEYTMSQYQEPNYLSIYNSPKSRSYELDHKLFNFENETSLSKIGKIYRPQKKYSSKNGVIKKESENESKDNSVSNQTRIAYGEHDSILSNNILVQENEDGSKSISSPAKEEKSTIYLRTKPNKSDLSSSLYQSKFRPKVDSQLLSLSESDEQEQVVNKDVSQNKKSLRKQSQTLSPYKSQQYSKYPKAYLKLSAASRKRYEKQNYSQIYSSALERINIRIQNSKTIFEDSTFRNTKHEHNNLFSRYNLETKLRKVVKDKLSRHHLAEKKYGLI